MTLNKTLFGLMVFLSFVVALVAFRFLAVGMAGFPGMEGHIELRLPAFYTHIIAAPIALALGAVQFFKGLRARRPGLHRWMGRAYGAAILLGGLAGLVMALGILAERPVAGLGFGLLAVLWIGVTARAVQLAMARRIGLHRRWMIRSFALTFAAVMLRLEMPLVIMVTGPDYVDAANVLAWLGWVPNLIVAEWLLTRKTRAQLA